MTKKLYTAFSAWQWMVSLALKLLASAGIFYCYAHYDDNPVVVVVAIVICLSIILFFGNDQVTVYTDKVVQTDNSFFTVLFKTKPKVFPMNEIKGASLQQQVSGIREATVDILATMMLNTQDKKNISRSIFLDMKNGDTKRIDTDLEISKREKIIVLINSLVEKKDQS